MAKSAALVDTADRLALVASGACMLHCLTLALSLSLTLPLLFAALPVLSSSPST